jgi:hypothetical protein
LRNLKAHYMVNGLGLPVYDRCLPKGVGEAIYEAHEGDVEVDAFEFKESEGDIYIDGSLMHQPYPWLAVMSAAIVQPDTGKKLGIFIERGVPCSSSVAEGYALSAGRASLAEEEPAHRGHTGVWWTDSKVLRSCVLRNKVHETTNPSKVVDGFARMAIEESVDKPWILNKTKAHRSREQAVSDGDLTQYLGNAMADEEAKRINLLYGPTEAQVSLAKGTREFSKKLIASIVEALVKAEELQPFLAPKKKEGESKWRGPKPSNIPVAYQHQYRHTAKDRWMCFKCMKTHRVSPLKNRVTRCSGITCGLLKQIRAARAAMPQHSLHLAWEDGGDGRPVMVCTSCGSYTSGSKCKLGEGCTPGRNKRALAYIRRRRHPSTNRCLEGMSALDDAKASQLTKVAISTLKGEALLKRYVRLVGVQDHVLQKDQQDVESFLATLLEEEGFGGDDLDDCA